MSAFKPRTHTVATFSIEYLQFIDEHYKTTQTLPPFATPDTLLELYRLMTLTRTLDNKAVTLQRQGKMGTYPPSKGQEAIGVGVGHALEAHDVFCPYYRDQGTLLQRGITMDELLLYWSGDERGSQYQHTTPKQDTPICVPIAGQCLHAAGIAYAIQYRKESRAVLTTLGDGGTSKGDFYEALNVAGVWKLPLVFVVNNNQWAISVPLSEQTACQTLAQKAIAAGLSGWQVDGNDVVAVRYAVDAALQKARKGQGPTLIEALSYRLCDHTTADDATRYIASDKMRHARQLEPIARLGYYLESQQLWSKTQEAALQQECKTKVAKAIQVYQQREPQPLSSMFDYLYETLPKPLHEQYDELLSHESICP